MTGRTRVIVWYRIEPAERPEFEAAYAEVSRALAGVPGLVGNELLRDVRDPDRFAVLSEWESGEAFREWEGGDGHRGVTAPLRPYQDTNRSDGYFGVYDVVAAYDGVARERTNA